MPSLSEEQLQLAIFGKTRPLYSQDCFTMSTAAHLMGHGGYGSGKTEALIERALYLTHMIPDNRGMLGRYAETELEATTQAQFFERLPRDEQGKIPILLDWKAKKKEATIDTWCPEGARRKPRPSVVTFQHIHETRPGRDHLSGGNWGWFGIDQAEDILEQDWNKLQGRLRRTHVLHRYAFGVANPKGHDWSWRRWGRPGMEAGKVEVFQVASCLGPDKTAEVKLYHAQVDHLLIKTQTAENIYLPDGYIQNMIDNNTKEWVERYLMGSSEQWQGKIYKEFFVGSRHIINPFQIPRDWPAVVGIDVGGDTPWGGLVGRMNPASGEIYITNEYYESGILTQHISNWLKNPTTSGLPVWQEARYIIDPENKTAVYELANHDIICEAAYKGPVIPGILRVGQYLHCKEGHDVTIPNQYSEFKQTRGQTKIANAPYLFVFNTCKNFIREMDEYQWERDKGTNISKERPVKANDHLADALRYMVYLFPDVDDMPEVDEELERLRKLDRGSYLEAVANKELRTGRKVLPTDKSMREVMNTSLMGDHHLMEAAVKKDETVGIPWLQG